MSAQLLQDRDYTILIARSHASRDRAHPWYQEWIEAQTALIDLAKQCQQFDPDGFTIYEVSGMILKYSQSDVATFARILLAAKSRRSDQERWGNYGRRDRLSGGGHRRGDRQFNYRGDGIVGE